MSLSNGLSLTTPDEYIARATLYTDRKRPKDAEVFLRQGVEAFPEDLVLLRMLGRSLARTGPNAEATECFLNAWLVDENPTTAAAVELAGALKGVGRVQEAEGIYLERYHLDEAARHIVLTGLGDLYRATGLKGRAAACFKKAADTAPTGYGAAKRGLDALTREGFPYQRTNWEDFKSVIKAHAPGGMA